MSANGFDLDLEDKPQSQPSPRPQATLQPNPDLAPADYTVSGAKNPAINGPMTFRYPDAFTRIQIGARTVALIRLAGFNVSPDDLPMEARAYNEAIATLEYVIETAPEGWYAASEGQKVIFPGGLSGGDERELLKAVNAYFAWARRFRGEVDQGGEPRAAQALVQSSEAAAGRMDPPQ